MLEDGVGGADLQTNVTESHLLFIYIYYFKNETHLIRNQRKPEETLQNPELRLSSAVSGHLRLSSSVSVNPARGC